MSTRSVSAQTRSSVLKLPPCVNCRKQHVKCERSLNGCERCRKKGLACRYTIFAKDAQFALINYQEEQIARVSQVRKHTEIAIGTIVMEFDRMKTLLEYNQDVCTHQKISILPPKYSELALMFGVQVLSFARLGHKQMAENLYRKTVSMIHENNVALDFEMAACYYYIGSYAGGRGRVKQALDMFRISAEYMERSSNIYGQVLLPLVNGQIQIFSHLRTIVPGVRAAVGTALRLADPNAVDDIEDKITKFMQQMVIVEYNSKINTWLSNGTDMEREMKRVNTLLNSKGALLEDARLRGEGATYLDAANSITNCTRSYLFPTIYPAATSSIVEASFVQAQRLLSSTDKKLNSLLIENLKQNLTALQVVAKRAELVEIMHGHFMEELATFIERYEAASELDFTLIGNVVRYPE